MKLIIPIDDRNGMAFNERRQSQDVKLREYILQLCEGQPLYMNAYSAKQFAAHNAPNIVIAEDYLDAAGTQFCFVETGTLAPYSDKITELYLCKWNRDYPSDTKFDLGLTTGWNLCSSTDIIGKSHPKITIEKWVQK